MKWRILIIVFVVIIGVGVGFGAYVYFDTPTIVLPKISAPTNDPAIVVLNNDIDWEAARIELTGLVTDLVRLPTVRKDEVTAALYLQKVLHNEGIEAKLIPNPDRPDKVSVFAEIGPEDAEDGIVLLNHLDVVEASAPEWSADPFAANMNDGKILGRGTLDMKGMAAMELVAFLTMHRQQIPLTTKIMFLSVPDEEDGGKYGAQFLLDKHEDLFDGYEYVINEGGFGIKDFPKPGAKIFNIQTAEKGVLGLELTAKSASGHGSMPDKKYSSLEIMRVVLELQSLQTFKLTPITVEFFHYFSQFFDQPQKFLLERIQNPLVQKLVGKKIMENRAMNAMVTNTISVTSLATNTSGPNVIPSEASAHLDIRLLPGQNPQDFLSQVKTIADKYNVDVKQKESFGSSNSTKDTDLYDILYSVLKDNVPDAAVTQYLSPGATDNRFFREKGFQCYGIIPILISMEDVGKLHGKNEDISLDNLVLGTKILFETLAGYNQIAIDQ